MTAKVIVLPVMRGLNAPAPELPCDCEPSSEPTVSLARKSDLLELCKGPLPADTKIPYEIELDFSVADQLEEAAEFANIDTATLIRALIIWGLKQVEIMPQPDFYNSLTAVADAKC